MDTEKRYCSICAWRETCQKRFSISTNSKGMVNCAEFTRDLRIKDSEIEEKEKRD
ncbi:MAG: hypothetical protein JXB42_01975 [Deltaproteobacteria bacterium]|nr:hypothetical protein [Deltaproteobacteria bacterium]